MGDNNKKKDNNIAAWWQPALILFVRFSAWIAFPVLIGVFLGKWMDKKCDTEPWLFLGCVGLAFIVSMFGLVKNVIHEYKKIEKDSGGEKKEDKNSTNNKDTIIGNNQDTRNNNQKNINNQ